MSQASFLWLGNPHWWMKSSRHWLYPTLVLFFFLSFYSRCRRLLISFVLRVSHCVTRVSCMAWESVFNSSKNMRERWLTSSKISNDVGGKPCCRWPWGNRSHVECFPLVRRKGPGYGFKWKTRCVLYCILLPFVLHLIVNWIYSEKIILC